MENYFRVTIEVHDEEIPEYDIKLMRETPNPDISYDELIETFKFMAVGLTFSESQFNDMLINYIEDRPELVNKILRDIKE